MTGLNEELTSHLSDAPLATAPAPPVGGVIKQRPEDFLVEEIPAYQPCGQGEHIYMFVEKKGLSTSRLLEIIGAHFDVGGAALGYAGLKDTSAITRQVISVHAPGKTAADFPMLRHDGVQVLWTDQHTNKLRVGHLRGNRFSIRIRDVKPTDALIANRVLRYLEKFGAPNYFGEQRFGGLGNNAALGRCVVRGDAAALIEELLGAPAPASPGDGESPPTPDGAANSEPEPGDAVSIARMRARWARGDVRGALGACPRGCEAESAVLRALLKGRRPKQAMWAIPARSRHFWVSALQSAVFNAVLAERVRAGTLGDLHEGDVAMKHAGDARGPDGAATKGGACFVIDRETAESEDVRRRARDLEISPSGPLWGARMLRARGSVDEREREALGAAGLSIEDFEGYAQRSRDALPGARRALRVPVLFPEVEGGVDDHGPFIRCAFELPPGSYATVVMREVMKTGV